MQPIRLKRPTITGLVAFAFLFCIASEAAAQCTKDTDCKGDRICKSGECVDPSSSKSPDPVLRHGSQPQAQPQYPQYPSGQNMPPPQNPMATVCMTAYGPCPLVMVLPVGIFCECFNAFG